jgi:hypothetical protein
MMAVEAATVDAARSAKRDALKTGQDAPPGRKRYRYFQAASPHELDTVHLRADCIPTHCPHGLTIYQYCTSGT